MSFFLNHKIFLLISKLKEKNVIFLNYKKICVYDFFIFEIYYDQNQVVNWFLAKGSFLRKSSQAMTIIIKDEDDDHR